MGNEAGCMPPNQAVAWSLGKMRCLVVDRFAIRSGLATPTDEWLVLTGLMRPLCLNRSGCGPTLWGGLDLIRPTASGLRTLGRECRLGVAITAGGHDQRTGHQLP